VVDTGSNETRLSANQAYPHMQQPFVKELLGIVSVGLMILTVSQIVQVHWWTGFVACCWVWIYSSSFLCTCQQEWLLSWKYLEAYNYFHCSYVICCIGPNTFPANHMPFHASTIND